jgi:hypothetical protein
MPSGAEIVAQLNQEMEEAAKSESSTENDLEALEPKAEAEAKQTPKADSSSTKGSKGKGEAVKTGKPDIPYDRFKEKVDQVTDLTGKLDKLIASQELTTARENDLRQKIQALEEEAETLDRVRALAEDPRYRPIVEKLDKALKGVDEEVESGVKTEKEGKVDVTKILRDHRQELDTVLADQRADMLLEQCRMISDNILESLPEDYDDTDKALIIEMIPKVVEWNAIEEDPSRMKSEMIDGYKRALVRYGEPRGALKAKLAALETNKSEDPETKVPSDEEFVQKILSNERLSKVRTNDEGKVLGPEMSEIEFEKDFADVLRAVNRAR